MSTPAKPPIKWVGGKTQLLPQIQPLLPKRIGTYYEPFIGGGAVFWSLADRLRATPRVINDRNTELINCYKVIRDFPEDLMQRLTQTEQWYAESPQAVYATIRNSDALHGGSWADPVGRAARFILLNKAGFNGLYRVNRAGKFNVPWGKKLTVKTFDRANILACSAALAGTVSITNGDYWDAVQPAQENDLVYFDPPYVPASPTASFTSYTASGFGEAEQRQLGGHFRLLYNRGVNCILSNSDTPLVREIYQGFEMTPVQARRAINCKGDARGTVGELLICSRPDRAADLKRYLDGSCTFT